MIESIHRDGCGCEARIPAGILEGYACGRPECWRTGVVKASFDAFVADLVARRDQRRQAAEPGEA